MANEKLITTSALIEKFQYAIDVKGGYIYGAAGEEWTAAKQAAATREQTVKYGKRWIGHQVWDCSGLFAWAFKQLGGYMYHGSNTMWNSYCTAKGELKKGKREDGKELKPGTAVFVYHADENKRSHVGLFIGNNTVIEAASTQKGVITSKITDSKWTEWGELKGVYYGDSPEPVPVPVGKAVVTGKNVALRQGPSKSTPVMTRIVTGTTVDIAKIEGWTYVRFDNREGFMMNEYIQINNDYVVVTGVRVALRAGTGTNTKVLMRIETGTVVPRIPLPDDWEYIAYGSKNGFMMKEYLREG